jgi:hypothetical protein
VCALAVGGGYCCDQDAVLRGVLGLQGLSRGPGGACACGLAAGGVGCAGGFVRGMRGGDDDSGVYRLRVAVSEVRGGV